MTKMSAITFMNILSIMPTCPSAPIFRKIVKIYSGKTGIITFFMRMVISSPNSEKPRLSASPFRATVPYPKTKEIIRAAVTSITGGISTVKYGFITAEAISLTSPIEELLSRIYGYTALQVK